MNHKLMTSGHKMRNVERYNTVRYGKKSLRILGPQIWNSLPNEYKTTTNLDQFKSDEPVEWSEMLM